MTKVQTAGGTNMLDAVKSAAEDLNEEKYQFPDYVSAFYLMGMVMIPVETQSE